MVKKLARRTRLLVGIVVGALLMFLFDPEQGAARRTRLREQLRPSRTGLEDEIGSDAPRPVSGRAPRPSTGASFEVESTVSPRPLAG